MSAFARSTLGGNLTTVAGNGLPDAPAAMGRALHPKFSYGQETETSR